MTERNIKLRRGSRWEDFWSELKRGYDLFERSHVPPVVSACNGHYVFEPGTIATANAAVEERCPPKVAETP
jgi:murein L,D-transpeptidase YafK